MTNVATLTVNLSALRANYQLLKSRHAKQSLAAVVKANAYGLGVKDVADALWAEGCRTFFVATLEEALPLRKQLPDARIGVFNGLLPKEEKKYIRYRLTPVLNDLGQVQRWEKSAPASTPAIIHIDTGMTRLGLNHTDFKTLAMRHQHFCEHNVAYVMSHLACANEPSHAKNMEQLARFRQALQLLPRARGSLCNSSGLFLDPKYHFDMARPGCALYGINPTNETNPMQQVATLSAPLLQVRTLDVNESVGYGATYNAPKGSRIAITGLGYADGWMRLQSNAGFAYVAGVKVPLAGRVSMDMIALDVSQVPEKSITPNTRAEFINDKQTVDAIANACGTIGYEIFTRIGKRVQRNYIT
jgi:alanine racemase